MSANNELGVKSSFQNDIHLIDNGSMSSVCLLRLLFAVQTMVVE